MEANSVGINNNFYIFILGLLLPAFSFTGFDGPAHMTEESVGAALAAPRAIVHGVLFMIVAGWIWVVSLLFCVSDYTQVVGAHSDAGGNPIPQIFYDAFKQRTGSGVGGIVLLLIPLGGTYFCAHATLTYVARIVFCYARDRAVPLSHLWGQVDARTQSPLMALWATAFLALMLGLPMLDAAAVFNAILSLSTIALNIAYVLPFTARITWGRRRFRPGPWNLGRWSTPIGIVATAWVAFIVVVFSLPTEYPTDASNLNFAGVMLLGVLFLSLAYFWCPVWGAYRWFHGPVCTAPIGSVSQPLGGDASLNGVKVAKDVLRALKEGSLNGALADDSAWQASPGRSLAVDGGGGGASSAGTSGGAHDAERTSVLRVV